ncbi:MAG TPA: antitoxin VbhA family protein [Propionibacteriaceae bacterium]
MTTPLLIPLEGFGHHGPPWAGDLPAHPPLFLGALMFPLFLLLLAGTFFFLVRSGRIQRFGPPPWAGHHTPEGEAKKILAERFARGDISTEEFMERASVLNWTPGSDPLNNWKPTKKRR